jgi:hypothetical protein|tara:strand:- start:15128 stop:15265 length:138 start_codon:yes stop_codon:yes gene_type:complete
MITSATDLAYWRGWELTSKPKVIQKELFISLTEDEEVLLRHLMLK